MGEYGSNDGQFRHPASVVIAGAGGDIVVADKDNSRVQVCVVSAVGSTCTLVTLAGQHESDL